MAKKKKKNIPLPVRDLTNFYTDLAYFPTEYKESRLYMAQSLFYAKRNSRVLQDPLKAKVYRDLDLLILNKQEYKNIVDPPTPKDGGGKAEFFSSNFGAIPIDTHLDNIMDATVRQMPLSIVCSIADPVAKLQEQKDKDKIIAQRMVREIINGFIGELGMPKISESADPYKWIQNFTAKKGEQKVDVVGDAIDQIKNKIKDDDGLRLFQNYIYKNGLEIAFEIGIKYYLIDQNEFDAKFASDFFRDIKHFNKAAGIWAIDQMTGQGKIRYVDPSKLYTSPFKDRNGDDILYYFYEENVTMAEFEVLVGAEMTDEEKKLALKLQREQGWLAGTSFNNNSNKNNSQIRVGYFGLLTQEANAFAEIYVNDKNTIFEKRPLTWIPDPNVGESKEIRAYNVWYGCYYLPLLQFNYTNNSPTDWALQSKYIFNIQKDIDMIRYGADKRYVKSPLVLWSDYKRPSWTDIKEEFMPKMRTLWHKFENCIAQDVQGIALDQDLLGGMLNAIDESNKEGKEGGTAIVNEWKMLRQAGMVWLKFRDKNGNMVVQDPSRLFVPVDSGHMKKAEMYLTMIMNLYNIMTQALAKGQANEGLTPDARTPVAGIEIANMSSNKANFYLEESYSAGVVIPFAMRCAHHILTMAKENKELNYSKRWKQFTDVIGAHNGAVIESIEDINFENIGLTITNKDESAKRELVIQSVIQKNAQKQITTAGMGLVLGTANWKYQLMELALEEDKADEKAQAAAAQQQQYTMQQMQMQLQIAQALAGAKGAAKDKNIQTQGQIDAQVGQLESQLKEQNMERQKDQLLKNKLIENQQKSELKKGDDSHAANLESQKSFAQA